MHLTGTVTRHDTNGRALLDVTLHNPGETMALMAHLQLRRKSLRREGAAGVLLR